MNWIGTSLKQWVRDAHHAEKSLFQMIMMKSNHLSEKSNEPPPDQNASLRLRRRFSARSGLKNLVLLLAGIIGFGTWSADCFSKMQTTWFDSKGATKKATPSFSLCATPDEDDRRLSTRKPSTPLPASRQQECYATDVGVDTGALIRTVKVASHFIQNEEYEIKHLLRGIFAIVTDMKERLFSQSQSPRRLHLLQAMGVKFIVEPSDYDEKLDNSRLMSDVAHGTGTWQSYGRCKASVSYHYWPRHDRGVDGKQLEKPVDIDEARKCCYRTSTSKSEVVTGVAVVCIEDGVQLLDSASSLVCAKSDSPPLNSCAKEYLAAENWRDKAGGWVSGCARYAD